MARRKIKERGTVIDLFCGCGGFSLGAELAGLRSIASIDIDPTLQSAYRRNFPHTRAIQASVADMDSAVWNHLIGKIRPDGLIGGPPCQGFSRIGKSRKDDPRNSLLGHFYRQVRILRPKFFVMENVEGLLDAGKVDMLSGALENLPSCYRVLAPLTVNAAEFGAPTSRRRVAVIGYDPEQVDPIEKEEFQLSKQRFVTVREAIADLPSPITEDKIEGDFGWIKYPRTPMDSLPKYAQLMRKMPPPGLGWGEALDRQQNGFVSGLIATRHSTEVARRYAVVGGGKTDPITKAYRLTWDGQCPTIRAGTGADKGAFQAVRPLHPGKARVITVREGARLQGFPDWFIFHPTKWHSFRMIGNSVSPFVSHGLLDRIASKIA